MNRAEIALSISQNARIAGFCRKLSPDLGDDLLQEAVMLILEMSASKLQRLAQCGEVEKYICGAIRRMWMQPRSAFNIKYRGLLLKITLRDVACPQDEDGRVKELLENEYWYDTYLLEYVDRYGSMKEVARRTGIPYNSVNHSIKNLIKRLREKINSDRL